MRNSEARFLSCLYVLSLTLLAVYALHGLQRSVTVAAETVPETLIILDAGHGGPDGGSTASDGTRESDINLEVVRRTEAVLGLLGRNTLLVRETDADLSTPESETISQKKVSDIRNRVLLVNSHPEGILVSIHQNTYPSQDCRGGQVFYGKVGDSQALGEAVQTAFAEALDSSNRRQAKPIAADIYLMNHITVPGILVECGFLSNPEEAALLKTADYQKRLAAVIAVSVENYLSGEVPGV